MDTRHRCNKNAASSARSYEEAFWTRVVYCAVPYRRVYRRVVFSTRDVLTAPHNRAFVVQGEAREGMLGGTQRSRRSPGHAGSRDPHR